MAVLVWTLIQLIPVVLIVAILLKIFQLFKKKHDLQVAFKDFPGPPPNWLAGNMKEVRQSVIYLFRFLFKTILFKTMATFINLSLIVIDRNNPICMVITMSFLSRSCVFYGG